MVVTHCAILMIVFQTWICSMSEIILIMSGTMYELRCFQFKKTGDDMDNLSMVFLVLRSQDFREPVAVALANFSRIINLFGVDAKYLTSNSSL